MARKRYSDEDILRLLREVEVHLATGSDAQSARWSRTGRGDFITVQGGNGCLA